MSNADAGSAVKTSDVAEVRALVDNWLLLAGAQEVSSHYMNNTRNARTVVAADAVKGLGATPQEMHELLAARRPIFHRMPEGAPNGYEDTLRANAAAAKEKFILMLAARPRP